MDELSDQALLRYSRHLLLPEIDIEGQQKIGQTRLLVIGCGGLAASAVPILAASGVGFLHLVDFDCIELSNLQRQTAFTTQDIGQYKALALQQRVLSINPEIQVSASTLTADEQHLTQWLAEADIILDASDNFATRQLINRLAFTHKKVLISAAAIRFDGQLAVYSYAKNTPCYACLFPPTHADDGLCSTLGVFAPLVHIMGSFQAQETLKYILGIGESLVGRLRTYNALSGQWHDFKFSTRRDCPVCGKYAL